MRDSHLTRAQFEFLQIARPGRQSKAGGVVLNRLASNQATRESESEELRKRWDALTRSERSALGGRFEAFLRGRRPTEFRP